MDLWLLPSPMCPRQTETGSQAPSGGRLLNVHVGMAGGILRCQAVRHIQRTVAQCHAPEESFLGLGNTQQDPTAIPELSVPGNISAAHENQLNWTCALRGTWVTAQDNSSTDDSWHVSCLQHHEMPNVPVLPYKCQLP